MNAQLYNRQAKSYPWDVFVSHNKRDSLWVSQFVAHLKAGGLQVFYDETSIPPGGSIIRAIEAGLSGSRFIVFLISRAALTSPWVGLERASSFHMDPASEEGRIIPVLLDPIEIRQLPITLQVLRVVDLTHPVQRHAEYRLLLQHLGVPADASLEAPERPSQSEGSAARVVPYPTVDQIAAEIASSTEVDLMLAGGDTFYPVLSSALRECRNRPRFRVLLRASSGASQRTWKKLAELSQKTGTEIQVRWYDNDFMLRGYCFDRTRGFVSYFLRQDKILTGRRNPMVHVIRDRSDADRFLVDMFLSVFDSTFSSEAAGDAESAHRVPFVKEQ